MKFKKVGLKVINVLRAFDDENKTGTSIRKSTSVSSTFTPTFDGVPADTSHVAARLSSSLPNCLSTSENDEQKKEDELLIDMRSKYDQFRSWKKVRAEIQNIVRTPHLQPKHISVLNEMEVRVIYPPKSLNLLFNYNL